MYRAGEIVTLNVDKTEGAGENSLNVSAGITGMVLSYSRASGSSDYSYIVDFGPEGQWNCYHNELDGLTPHQEYEEVYDEDEEEEEEEEDNEEVDMPSPRAEAAEIDWEAPPPAPGWDNPQPKAKKKVSFEEDLKRMMKDAEKKEKANNAPF